MTNINTTAAILLLLSLPFTSFAGVYKCTVNGKTIYSDRPCGNEQTTINVMPKATDNPSDNVYPKYPKSTNKKYATPAVDDDDDYYSVENQLKRIEEKKAMDKAKRQEQYYKDEQLKLRKQEIEAQKKPKVDYAKCEYYKSRVKEEDHRLRKGYKSKQQRLSDESFLNQLRVLEAEYCG